VRAHLLLLGLVALPSSSCGDPSGPSPTSLVVWVSTTGVDNDILYTVRADEGGAHTVQSFLRLFLSPGEHDVVLEGVAENCSVQEPDSVRVTIMPGQVSSVAFQVECTAVTGAIEVTTPTSGRDFDPDGFSVHVDDVLKSQVFPGGSVVVEGLLPGAHVVRLDGFAANCFPSDLPTQTVLVKAGGLTRDTVRTTFTFSCEAITGDVRLSTTTAGADLDPNGYTVTIDGQLVLVPCGWYDYDCEPGTPLIVEPNASQLFEQVVPGVHTYELGDIASNCTVNGSNPRTVSVVVGDTSAVRFEVNCTDVP
jgi:hypothetical protein